MIKLFDKFRLGDEKEDLDTVVSNIENGVIFRGTNLWILIFAIFVASLGLNINATAVIIGAMLISPLMGPIMGIGLGIGILDVPLLRKAVYNYLIATGVALTTSTLFFLLSPLNDAHAEILARTAPTIYDTLIALFGGFAGIIAISSKQKGNVIPGVAIATALMPPLCTAGYGIATLQFQFFFGAFYLYIINTVFIALATFVIVRGLHFPYRHFQNKKAGTIAARIIWGVVIVTLIPSIYFGYDLVQQSRFLKNANKFVSLEAHFPNDYLLNAKIDAKTKSIMLVFGGKEISETEIRSLRSALMKYDLQQADLQVKQGFAYLAEQKEKEPLNQLTQALAAEQFEINQMKGKLDSLNNEKVLSKQLYAEMKAQYPRLKSAMIEQGEMINGNDSVGKLTLIVLNINPQPSKAEKVKLENWLKVRIKQNDIKLIFEE